MTRRLAYFAHDRGDAATRRRVAALQADGIEVSGFAMRRRDDENPDWLTVDLGLTRDNAYGQRLASIWRGVGRALARRDALAAADVMLARNLDMLAIAVIARARAGLTTPLIYECLDIHRLMVREDPVGRLFRAAEGFLMRRSTALWVSSPAFLSEYFERRQNAPVPARLVENRMAARPGPRPSMNASGPARPLRLGWFGNLRCPRSLSLMERLGALYPDRLEIHLRGYPALGEIPDFEARVARVPAIRFHGRYRAPDDLARIYGEVDLVWAGDFMDAGFNSDWLLPNRIYEGGWFACPPIAPATAETGRWIAAHRAGFTIADTAEAPVETTAPALIGRLLDDPSPILAAQSTLLALPEDMFVAPPGTMAALIEDALRRSDDQTGA